MAKVIQLIEEYVDNSYANKYFIETIAEITKQQELRYGR